MSKIPLKQQVSKSPAKGVFLGDEDSRTCGDIRSGLDARSANAANATFGDARTMPRSAGGSMHGGERSRVRCETAREREELLAAARRRQVDMVVVWRLDRWGQVDGGPDYHASGTGGAQGRVRLADEALDLHHAWRPCTRRNARRFCGVRKGYSTGPCQSRYCGSEKRGQAPRQAGSAALHTAEIRKLFKRGVSKRDIAKRLNIGNVRASAAAIRNGCGVGLAQAAAAKVGLVFRFRQCGPVMPSAMVQNVAIEPGRARGLDD